MSFREVEKLKDRIKELRKELHLSQEDFAARVGLSRNFISAVEAGQRNISERTIRDISREFKVDDAWLRTGIGEMFRPRTREDEITAFFADLLSPDATDFQRDFVAILATLSPEAWDLMEKKLNELAELSRRRQENEK